VRVCVLTTSYPRFAGDASGAFVADQVEQLRRAGAEVVVVSPADFSHLGVAFGAGIAQNLRARPWLLTALPLFLVRFARAARRAARDCDVVHAHWLVSALPALATGKPFVLQPWGTDAELARRLPFAVRPVVRRAVAVVCASPFLAGQASALGAGEVVVVPLGVDLPEHVAEPEIPPHVLYVGRLSEEKGVRDFLAASAGLPRVVVGDGPLRGQAPDAVGFVPHERLGEFYERAAIVCVPSRREGYGVVAREAMAYGRPVVATAVGGLRDAVLDEETGLLVEPGHLGQLRAALERLLDDPALAARLGANARAVAARDYSWPVATAALLEVYTAASRRHTWHAPPPW
jgi:glycosyltransferase involved in cell wall biosynthesis